ncbi:MAG: NADH-quinone oxidoreductase subunit C [Planctomycetes bacterium]|nr:NADH-quinone oxidoreductase subunit C [Planctomycetota bacterium]
MDLKAVIEELKKKFADQVLSTGEHAGQPFAHVRRDRIVDILRWLRDVAGFDLLADLCGVDYLNQGMPERFCVVYNLTCVKESVRFRVKAFVPETDAVIDSVAALWKSAPWAEREAFDMYGIRFRGHPDLKRILLPEGYRGFPLRKDYPLIGEGERQNFPRYTRDAHGTSH